MCAVSPLKMTLQFAHMIVWKHAQNRAAQFCAVDQRGVTKFVEQDYIILAHQCWNRAQRRCVSTTETKGRFSSLPFRQRAFQTQMRGQVSSDQARRPGADSEFVDRLLELIRDHDDWARPRIEAMLREVLPERLDIAMRAALEIKEDEAGRTRLICVWTRKPESDYRECPLYE